MIRNRYRRIVWFFARLLAGFVVWDLILPRVGLRGWARKTRPERLRRGAHAYRRLAVQMGGVMIKVGQFLSTRVDVLPKEFTDELTGLQDEVPAEPFEAIRRAAEAEYGAPLGEKFAWFDEQPLAAASLGQVHRARLHPKDGPFLDVVVKVQRPGIEAIIATDLAALGTVGNWLRRYRPISRRADVPALLDEFTRILYEEIDYLAEGRNAETFAANFKGSKVVRVPSIVWSHTTRRALTLENVLAIKITDYEAITAAGIDRGEVASRLLDAYLQQIFEDGFFHADPHPGNLFVQPVTNPAEGQPAWLLTFVDFGMVGRVPGNIRAALREMLVGVGTQDAARVVKSYQMLGVLLPSADLDLLEKAEARAFERFWGKSMKELQQISPEEVRQFADEFRELIFTLPFQIPQDIIFLARCVGILSGMCTGLDPHFNVWNHLRPYAEKMIADEVRGGREVWVEEALAVAKAMLGVPRKMDAMLAKMERGDIAVRSPEITRQIGRVEAGLRQVTVAIIFAALLLAGVQVWLAGQETLALILFGGAGLSLAAVALSGLKR